MIQKIFDNLCENNSCIINECHIHEDGYDFACINKIERITRPNPIAGWEEEDVGKYVSKHSISGGKNEAVFNTYEYKHNSFIKALITLIPIDVVAGASSFEELDEYCKENDAW